MMFANMFNRTLVAAMILGFLASASAVALMGVSAWLIATASTQPPVLTLTVAAVCVRFFALGRAAFRYAERLVGHEAAFRGLTGMRVRIYESLERLAPVGLARFTRGDLLTRIVGDVDAALDLALRVMLPWAQAALVAIATIAFLWWALPSNGAVTSVLVAIALLGVPAWAAFTARRAQARIAPLQAELATSVDENLRASRDLEVFGAIDAAKASTGSVDAELTSVARNQAIALGSTSGVTTVMMGISVVSALALGIPAVTSGAMAPVWLAVIALLPLALFDILATLPTSALMLVRVRTSASRLDVITDEPSPVDDAGTQLLPPGVFSLHVDELSAGWTDATVLRGISFDVREGERFGIVGPSGSGKSTLAAVLMRFLNYTGSIHVNGVELAQLNADAYREHIGFMGQNAHIFDTTLAQNLRLARPQATDDELRAVLDEVQLGAWCAGLPKGFDTEVGSFGVALSGGERQRIALARVLLQRRNIIIVDEPTEHLDLPTAAALETDLLAATAGKTTIIITHRLAALVDVDRIAIMNDGKIVDIGTHEELVTRNAWFAEQWLSECEAGALMEAIAAITPGTGERMVV